MNSVCGLILETTLFLADSKQVKIDSEVFPSVFEDPSDNFIAPMGEVSHIDELSKEIWVHNVTIATFRIEL